MARGALGWQTELMDPSMIAGSIGLSQALDKRFGRTTTGAKMTDVPGHTRGLISPLASNGVEFLDIGVNGASMPAELPPLFLWKDSGDSSMAVMYHLGYGSRVTFRVPISWSISRLPTTTAVPTHPTKLFASILNLRINFPTPKFTRPA